jgi:3,4-dihydroxyphenylacetate 2,3-dioxygenase
MGQVVLAAKVTHVPSLLISEREGPLKGRRADAIASLKEIGRRAHERAADTFLALELRLPSQCERAARRRLYEP